MKGFIEFFQQFNFLNLELALIVPALKPDGNANTDYDQNGFRDREFPVGDFKLKHGRIVFST